MKQQRPLLTKKQLIDWLIYHCPLEEGNDIPFVAEYRPQKHNGAWGCRTFASTPWEAYDRLAFHLMEEPAIHREITELYWYWTI